MKFIFDDCTAYTTMFNTFIVNSVNNIAPFSPEWVKEAKDDYNQYNDPFGFRIENIQIS